MHADRQPDGRTDGRTDVHTYMHANMCIDIGAAVFFGEDLSALNVEIIPLGYPEMGLGLCARKGLRKRCGCGRSRGRSEDEQAVEHTRNLQDTDLH